MLMVAIREHGYLGRRRAIGEKYEVRSKGDATVLRVAGLARDATQSEKKPAPAPAPVKSVPNIVAAAEDEPIVYETRDEQPEEISGELTSPKDTKRKHGGRRYKRNDMVPED